MSQLVEDLKNELEGVVKEGMGRLWDEADGERIRGYMGEFAKEAAKLVTCKSDRDRNIIRRNLLAVKVSVLKRISTARMKMTKQGKSLLKVIVGTIGNFLSSKLSMLLKR